MERLLDNIAWHSLTGSHMKYAMGARGARRYALGFPPLAAFANAASPDFQALAPYCKSGEHLYCNGWTGAAPAGWRIEDETSLLKMLWEGAAPAEDEVSEAVKLGPEHAAQAFELASLTRPGPFGARALELGGYLGCFDGPRLVAMAGERMQAGALREISSVCTHPDFQGRGFARRLVTQLVRDQMLRGETPFLHVIGSNSSTRRLYERMGFCGWRETVARTVTAP